MDTEGLRGDEIYWNQRSRGRRISYMPQSLQGCGKSSSKGKLRNVANQDLHEKHRNDPAIDYFRPFYSIGGLTNRDIHVGEMKSAALKLPPSSRTTPPEPTRTSKSWIPNWSYKKSSIAAASIFTVITAAAIVFLAVLLFRRLQRNWKRRKRGNNDTALKDSSTDNSQWPCGAMIEEKRKRERMMFSENTSRTYVVEHNRGSVTRVYCAGSSGPINPQDSKISGKMRSEAARHLEAVASSQYGRSGSIPKQIVVVSSPLEPVVSRSAVTITPSEAILPGYKTDNESPHIGRAPSNVSEHSTLKNRFRLSFSEPISTVTQPAEAALPSLEGNRQGQNAGSSLSSTGGSSNPAGVFRLPSIKKTMSPLFSF